MSTTRAPSPPSRAARSVGPWLLDAADAQGWHPGRLAAGEEPVVRLRLAEGAHAPALEALARRVARLGELTHALVSVVALLRDGPRLALAVASGDTPPLAGSVGRLEPWQAWMLAHDLASVVDAGASLGLHVTLDVADVCCDPATGLATVTGIDGIAPALGHDPRAAAVAWAEVVLAAIGAPRGPEGWDLEAASAAHSPALLQGLRRALAGEAPGAVLLHPAQGSTGRHRRELAAQVRMAAARPGATRLVRVTDPGQGPFLAAPSLGGDGLLALDLALDRVVSLSFASGAGLEELAPDARAAQLEARRRAIEHGEGAPRRSLLLRAAEGSIVPHGPLRVWPLRGSKGPPPPPPPTATPPALRASVLQDGQAELKVEGAAGAEAVLVVRAREGQPLLAPEDGDLVATLAGETLTGGAGACADPTPGERYAAFPRSGGVVLPPGRATASDAVSIDGLEAKGAIGAIEVRWRVAPSTTVIVRHGASPPDSPVAGELLYWGREEPARVHDCLDPGQRVHYAAWAVGSRGGLAGPARAEAVALGPPPPLGAVKATPGPGRVALSWAWPESSSYDRVRVTRTPAWPEGAREVPRSAAPELVDDGAPLGQALAYALRTALDATPSVKESTVTSRAVAELASFTATGAGRAVRLALALPESLAAASVEVVRNLEREPRDMQDGGFVRIGKKREYSDEPLEAGKTVHYRACLVVDGQRSPGLLASATPTEQAADVTGLALTPGKASLEVRFTPPGDRCDEVRLQAGPAGGALAPVAFDLAAVRGGAPVVVPAVPGQPTRVQVVCVLGGAPGSPCEATGTAWDDVEAFAARPSGGAVQLSWSPPAAPPRAYKLRRTPKGKEDEVTELAVDPSARELSDPGVIARRSYVYALSCLWGPEGAGTETEARRAEVTVWAEPPDLERPEVRSLPGAVHVQWLPCGAKDRVNWDGVAVLTSSKPLAAVQRALEGRMTGTAEELAALGLEVVESRKKGKTKEQVRLHAPPPGKPLVVAVASQGGPLLKVCLIEAAVGLPEGFLTLRPEAGAAQPTLAWELPAWLHGSPARLVGLALARGLEEAAVEGIDPAELDQLAAQVRHELEPSATRFTDEQALPFVKWGYTLEATLDIGGRKTVVSGPRVVVDRSQGGKLVPKAEQARGLFGRKHEVGVTFALEGGKATQWPPFRLERGIDGQMGAKAVFKHPGGPPPGPWSDTDLGSLSKGMTLVYKVVLERARDGLGFGVGESRVTLG